MILESIMNFERGQIVRINPTNAGDPKRHGENRSVRRNGVVKKILIEMVPNTNGEPVYKPTGEIMVQWEYNKTPTSEHYSHLIIIK